MQHEEDPPQPTGCNGKLYYRARQQRKGGRAGGRPLTYLLVKMGGLSSRSAMVMQA